MSSEIRNKISRDIRDSMLKSCISDIAGMGIHSERSNDYTLSKLWDTVDTLMGSAYSTVGTPKELWKVLFWLYADSEANIVHYMVYKDMHRIRSMYALRFDIANIVLQDNSCISAIMETDASSITKWLVQIPAILMPKTRTYAGYTQAVFSNGGYTVEELLDELRTIIKKLAIAYFEAQSSFGNDVLTNKYISDSILSAEYVNTLLSSSDSDAIVDIVSGTDDKLNKSLSVHSFHNIFNTTVALRTLLLDTMMQDVKMATDRGEKFMNTDVIRQALIASSSENAEFFKNSVIFDKTERKYVLAA